MGYKEIIEKDIKKFIDEGFEKRISILMSGMLVARGEPYCTMYDICLIAQIVKEMLEDDLL